MAPDCGDRLRALRAGYGAFFQATIRWNQPGDPMAVMVKCPHLSNHAFFDQSLDERVAGVPAVASVNWNPIG